MTDDRPIGLFDSGVGGLTVLDAVARRLPAENLLYLGDTARLPYGTKSVETVRRYARRAVSLLLARGVKALVVACNTASALALDPLVVRGALGCTDARLRSHDSAPVNEFSGASYRAVSLVVDVPIRIDDLAPKATPAIAFVETEIQLVDERTAAANAQGENSHAAYKKRQVARVRTRLFGTPEGEEAVN